ncbi:MAG: tRNA (guanosine(46)-N7)-methyltransferase TrmB [Pseudomonadota bacterium]
MSSEDKPRHRTVRSYVVRGGRMTDGQQRAMAQHWPRYGLEFAPQLLDLDLAFGRAAPRHLEIGFGNGEHLAARASAHRDADFLGIEVHPPGVGHLLLDAAQRSLTNLRVICHDAVEVLQQQIPSAALDEVAILFPDPWHKSRHHKRRLIQDGFVALLADRIRPGGTLRLATDWQPYAEHMQETLARNPNFALLPAGGESQGLPAEREPTRFEQRGLRLGHTVQDLTYRRILS